MADVEAGESYIKQGLTTTFSTTTTTTITAPGTAVGESKESRRRGESIDLDYFLPQHHHPQQQANKRHNVSHDNHNNNNMETASVLSLLNNGGNDPTVMLPMTIPLSSSLSSSPVNNSENNTNNRNQRTTPLAQQQQQLIAHPKSSTSGEMSTTTGVSNNVTTTGNLPLNTIVAAWANKAQKQQKNIEPQLLHPILFRIPLQFRFGITGLLSNILFMVVYNLAVKKMKQVQPPVIYGVVYFFFIPASHLMVSLLVFGWPEKYLISLVSNYPIGLTALAIGGLLTAYLDQAGFNDYVALYLRDSFTFTTMPSRDARIAHEEGEFYSSIVVLIVTSIWTYVLSVYVNSPPANKKKKEL